MSGLEGVGVGLTAREGGERGGSKLIGKCVNFILVKLLAYSF